MATDPKESDEKSTESEDGHHEQQSREPTKTATEQETKDNVVDWEGSDDPENPRNWPAWKRVIQVVFASAFLLTA